jgi:hypothetical protein
MPRCIALRLRASSRRCAGRSIDSGAVTHAAAINVHRLITRTKHETMRTQACCDRLFEAGRLRDMKIFTLSIALFALFNEHACAQSPTIIQTASGEPKHLEVAEQLVLHLDLGNTDYSHGSPRVSFTSPCESHADCSGFADALLQYSYGFDKKEFRKLFGSGRPSAARYYEAIENQRGFTSVPHVRDIRPGDFLAVKYLTRTDNTGHVMLAAARPVQMERPKDPARTGSEQWKVLVIDSSESGHGPADTRHKKGPNGKDHDGVGEGQLRIYSDHAGNVTGFSWSTISVSKFKSPQEEPLIIGRLQLGNGQAP